MGPQESRLEGLGGLWNVGTSRSGYRESDLEECAEWVVSPKGSCRNVRQVGFLSGAFAVLEDN